MPVLEDYLKYIVANGMSDLHLVAGVSPIGRLNGDLVKIANGVFENKALEDTLYPILSGEELEYLSKHRNIDFSYEVSGLARFRINYYIHSGGIGAAFRVIPHDIPSVSDLRLLKTTLMSTKFTNGLVLVTGPTGSGKSSTLAALISYINTNKPFHIITIEDPIEFVHPNTKMGLVSQREVGKHTRSFASALRAALREDPDVIMVGEMRDLETIELAITAAETGHLVFASLHTNSAAKTIDRLVNVFPSENQEEIRILLADSLRAVMSQILVKRADGKGRIPVQEIMLVNTAVANLIREGRTFQINDVIQTSPDEGMTLMSNELERLRREKVIGVGSITK